MKDIYTGHPRLYFKGCDIKQVKSKLADNVQMQEWLEVLEKSAQDLLTMELCT